MNIQEISKDNYQEIASSLSKEDIENCFKIIESKDRCIVFPVLSFRSSIKNDIYPYWDKFIQMLQNENAFIKTIGLKLIAINTKWDKGRKLNIENYLQLCDDISLVVARACIQNLQDILQNTNFNEVVVAKIKNKFSTFNIEKRPVTHHNVLRKDIDCILKLITKNSN